MSVLEGKGIYMGELEDLSEKIIEGAEKLVLSEEEVTGENSASGQLFELLLNTRELCQMMENMVKNQIEVKDELIDKLHKELEIYRQGAIDRFVDEIIKEIIKIKKDMIRQISSEQWKELSAEEVKKQYTYIFEDLTDLLERQNIDAYRSEPGADFDASIHHPKTEKTEDKSLDKKIKESLSEGYTKENKTFIPERVVVYQYQK